MGIIAFILSRWKLFLMVAVVGAFAAQTFYIEYLKLQRSELKTEIKALDYRLKDSQANVKSLSKALDDQNRAVDDLKKEADERLAKKQAELLAAKKDAKKYKDRADEILNTPPSNPNNMCESAETLINKEITDNVK